MSARTVLGSTGEGTGSDVPGQPGCGFKGGWVWSSSR